MALMMVLAACSSSDITPTPTGNVAPTEGARLSSDFPGLVYGVLATQDGYMLNDSRICLAFYGDAFWERGNVWDSPDDLPRVTVSLNQQPVAQLQLAMIPPIIQISNGQGGTVGSTPSGYTYCFTTGDIATGRYVVDVVATTQAGFVHQFTWDLIVP